MNNIKLTGTGAHGELGKQLLKFERQLDDMITYKHYQIVRKSIALDDVDENKPANGYCYDPELSKRCKFNNKTFLFWNYSTLNTKVSLETHFDRKANDPIVVMETIRYSLNPDNKVFADRYSNVFSREIVAEYNTIEELIKDIDKYRPCDPHNTMKNGICDWSIIKDIITSKNNIDFSETFEDFTLSDALRKEILTNDELEQFEVGCNEYLDINLDNLNSLLYDHEGMGMHSVNNRKTDILLYLIYTKPSVLDDEGILNKMLAPFGMNAPGYHKNSICRQTYRTLQKVFDEGEEPEIFVKCLKSFLESLKGATDMYASESIFIFSPTTLYNKNVINDVYETLLQGKKYIRQMAKFIIDNKDVLDLDKINKNRAIKSWETNEYNAIFGNKNDPCLDKICDIIREFRMPENDLYSLAMYLNSQVYSNFIETDIESLVKVIAGSLVSANRWGYMSSPFLKYVKDKAILEHLCSEVITELVEGKYILKVKINLIDDVSKRNKDSICYKLQTMIDDMIDNNVFHEKISNKITAARMDRII